MRRRNEPALPPKITSLILIRRSVRTKMSIPDPVTAGVLSAILTFLAEQVRRHAGDELTTRVDGLRHGRSLSDGVRDALERAARRFETEYPDPELAKALTHDTRFHDLPSVNMAIREFLRNPYSSGFTLTLESHMVEVLPERYRQEATAAARFYIERLREELISVEALRGTLDMIVKYQIADDVRMSTALLRQIHDRVVGPPVQAALRSFIDYVVSSNEYIHTRGVRQVVRSVTLRTDDIYVPVDSRSITDVLRGDVQETEELDTESGDEVFAAGTPTEAEPVQGAIQALSAVVRDGRRMVVIGDPGTGKTMLCRFLTLTYGLVARDVLARQLRMLAPREQDTDHGLPASFWELLARTTVKDRRGEDYGPARLPFSVRLADYASAHAGNRQLGLRQYICGAYTDAGLTAESVGALLSEALDRGCGLILLDGLDEVIDPGDRARIADQIERLASGLDERNAVLVTSRVQGYSEVMLGLNFAHYVIQPLTRRQIEEFLWAWCLAVEAGQAPNAESREVNRNADRDVRGILSAIDGSQGVRQLARTPLLLMILALIYRNGASLPARRVELYRLAAQTLLVDWELAHGISANQTVSEAEAVRLLGPLASWIHSTEPTGMLAEDRVRDRLAVLLAKSRHESSDDPMIGAAVDDFLRRVKERTGMFVERRAGYYGFLHLTFEEYFAAREIIARMADAASAIYHLRHDPRWHEPIRLGIGFVSTDYSDDAAALIVTALLAEGDEAGRSGRSPDRYEDVLHRDLLLATQCLADCVVADTELRDRLVGRVVRMFVDSEEEGRWEPLRSRLESCVIELGASESAPAAVVALTEVMRSTSSQPYQRRHAVWALSHLTGAVDAARGPLLESMSSPDPLMRLKAVRAASHMTELPDEWIDVLLGIARDDQREDVRVSAMRSLGRATQRHAGVHDMLLEATLGDSERIHGNAAWALGQHGVATRETLDALCRLLARSNRRVRTEARDALRVLASQSPPFLQYLVERMNESAGTEKIHLVRVLGYVGHRDEKTTGILADLLESDDVAVRRSAVAAIGRRRLCSTAAGERILGMAASDNQVRHAAIWTLGRVRPRIDGAVGILLPLTSHHSSGVRSMAIQTLVDLGADSSLVEEALARALVDPSSDVRVSAVLAVADLGLADDLAIATMLDLMADRRPGVRRMALRRFQHLRSASPRVVRGVGDVLRQDDVADVRHRAAQSLGAIGRENPEAIRALLEAIEHDESPLVRGASAFSIMQLARYASRWDGELREMAMMQLRNAVVDESNRAAYRYTDRSWWTRVCDPLWEALWRVASSVTGGTHS